LDQYEREFYASDMWKKHYKEQTVPLFAEVQEALGLKYNLSKSLTINAAFSPTREPSLEFLNCGVCVPWGRVY